MHSLNVYLRLKKLRRKNCILIEMKIIRRKFVLKIRYFEKMKTRKNDRNYIYIVVSCLFAKVALETFS